jgi:hypothetical protein
VGDFVEVLVGNSNTVVVPNPSATNASFAQVSSINESTREVTLSNTGSFTPLPGVDYSIRRKIVKSKSSNVIISVGNDVYIANTLNVYTDDSSEYGYVASNSLPGYSIVDNIIESSLPNGFVSTISTNNVQGLGDYSTFLKTYGSIKFPQPTNLRNGDEIVYTAQSPLIGLESGESYFVKIVASNEIRLFSSKSQLASNSDFVRFNPNFGAGAHNFTLKRHEDRTLSGKRIVRKFPLNQSFDDKGSDNRSSSNVGILIDGVEIVSPESQDKIYYGPLKEFEVLNGGKGYDVINPPVLSIEDIASDPKIGIPTGTGAKVEPVVIGSVKDVIVDPQDFDFNEILSVSLTGGNGSGCSLEPVVGQRFREMTFDSRRLSLGGGIDITNETITFLQPHSLADGQHVIYNQNGNDPISIGVAYDPTNTVTGSLVSGDEYVVRFVNTSTIRLFKNDSDAFAGATGINTIGLSTATTASGIHKFRTLSQNNLRSVKVLTPIENLE